MNNETISKVYNLIILDESGSMESIKQSTINGFNELLQSVKRSAVDTPAIEQWVNCYSFNGITVKEQLALTKAGEQAKLDANSYRPDDMTPLYDAIGIASNNLQKTLSDQTGYSVLVTILTDGEENNSREYTKTAIGALITALRSQGWVFTYIGANHDVEKTALSINISNHLTFNTNVEEVTEMFEKNERSRKVYMDKVSKNKKNELQDDFFKDIDPAKN